MSLGVYLGGWNLLNMLTIKKKILFFSKRIIFTLSSSLQLLPCVRSVCYVFYRHKARISTCSLWRAVLHTTIIVNVRVVVHYHAIIVVNNSLLCLLHRVCVYGR